MNKNIQAIPSKTAIIKLIPKIFGSRTTIRTTINRLMHTTPMILSKFEGLKNGNIKSAARELKTPAITDNPIICLTKFFSDKGPEATKSRGNVRGAPRSSDA